MDTKNTFPVLTADERDLFELHLAAITTVQRPNLLDLLFGGLNKAPIVETPGKVGNASWRLLHSTEAFVYEDETERSNATPVESIRGYLKKRIAVAWSEAFPKAAPFPIDAFKMTAGDEPGTVDFWRVK
jgi:hypothetical protein